MTESQSHSGDDVVEKERRIREQEQEVREQDPAERPPDERHAPERASDKPVPPGQAEQPRG